MAMIEDMMCPQFEHKKSNEIKLGDVIIQESGGKLQYAKIIDISTAKPGKHGSAKFMFKGSNLASKKNIDITVVSGTKVICAKMKKTDYTIIDIYGEEVQVIANNSEVSDPPYFLKSDFSPEDISFLERVFEERGDEEITASIMSAPMFLSLEEVRKNSKLVSRDS